VLADVVAEIASIQQVHHEIKIFPVLEGVVHVDQEHILDLSQDLPLVHNRFHRPLRYNPSFAHLLHRILLLVLLPLHTPHSPKASLSNTEVVSKRILSYC